MPDLYLNSLQDLQQIVDQYYRVYIEAAGHSVIREVLSKWKSAGWEPIVFGGVLRDLVLTGEKANPKDIDVVMRNRTLKDLRADLSPYIVRETRFGGLQAKIQGVRFDIWPLYKTWAFKHSDLPVSVDNLVRTTFLNVEAVAAIPSADGGRLVVTENGFIAGINHRRLDINFANNPFPELAATRALITAKRLKFSMSSFLVTYIAEVIRSRGIMSLIHAQLEHYGRIQMSHIEIERYLEYGFGVEVRKKRTEIHLKH
jgi:hypothetical protein